MALKSRKHYTFYGIILREKTLEVNMTSNKIMIPLLSKRYLLGKLNQID